MNSKKIKSQKENNLNLDEITDLIESFNSSEKVNELGVFYKLNFLKHYNLQGQIERFNNENYYFNEYNKHDGQWVNKEDLICYIKADWDKYFCIYSEKSGYLEHIFKPGDKISDGQKITKIHQEGEYSKQNSTNSDNFHHYNTAGGYKKWKVNDGDYVKIGDIVCLDESYKNEETVKAEKSGFIDINKQQSYDPDVLLYTIRKDDDIRVKKKYINIPKIVVDEFSKNKEIKWENVSTTHYSSKGVLSISDDENISLLFAFNYIKGNDYIVFHINPKELKPIENDSISFLFENRKKIEFRINEKPIIIREKNNNRIIEFKSLITKSELELFGNIDFIKWKIKLKSDNREILGGEIGDKKCYLSKSNLIIVIKKYANEYYELVKKEILNYSPIEFKEKKQSSGSADDNCYVYLMHDTSNGYYKIGISNSPEYRERTLQSEKPTIKMITSKKYPIRKIAENIEKALHNTYSEKRLRGEWFNLTKDDIEHIKETLK